MLLYVFVLKLKTCLKAHPSDSLLQQRAAQAQQWMHIKEWLIMLIITESQARERIR